ncbi:nuclear cap binding protein [Trypanosoma rangeli]|uniref:Nuclear cap binding protein n=1 Tax=Trypanosoma rangeli TaxID=5698 RepID=A0A422NRP1_TRYRA|nr:nuclear cap binding protein [Trypanosoma rangeli]RNF08147.1 nuclear cap binding protein [Trypanosoma rangeli]|eukprot:RNF08147.1 nuclear cap binding protein [Trypanosoma rangeli]
MNARGQGRVGFRGGRGTAGFSVAPRAASRNGDSGGRGLARGRGRGRGGGFFYAAAGRSEAAALRSLDDGNGEDGANGAAPVGTAHAATEKCSTVARKERHVTTMLLGGTELPKKLNNKVFIDGLPYEHKATPGSASLEEELMQFAAAWRVGRPIRLIKKDGQGFGFLVFHSPHSVDVAVRVLNGRKFLGRTLRVEVPKPKDMVASDADAGRDAGKSSFARQVLLADLAKITQPDILREILCDVAPQLEKRLESIKMTSNNRKAFLTFVSAEDVESAVKFLDGFFILGRRITAARAAAPGSLPYSKSPNHNQLHTGNAVSTGADAYDGAKQRGSAHDGANAAEDEAPVLPLGVVRAPATRQEVKGAERQTVREGKPSNITGVTEKYNLLEVGPTEVLVGNLGDEVTEEQLRSHFDICGRIVSCEILVNKSTSLPTGIARIVFALPAYARYAQKHLHGSRLHGHVIRVDLGDEQSAPLASELMPRDDEEAFDEDGYMERYGVKDKAAYFKGTSLEEGRKDLKKNKRTREAAADGKVKKKKEKREEAETSGFARAGAAAAGDEDDDEEECFHDVDEVTLPATSSSGRRDSKKRLATASKKGATRAKKSSR